MKQEVAYITCDQCGATDASEVRWGLRGHDFGVDLCATCMDGFDALLAPYLTFSHKIKPVPFSLRVDRRTSESADITPKRKRRTKAEMTAARLVGAA